MKINLKTDKQIEDIFGSFRDKTIIIIGDVMVDAYLWGNVDRISPEVPVPIVNLQKRDNRLGGAANVALNIHALNAKPILCSVVGDDVKGKEFIKILKKYKLKQNGISLSAYRKTTTKFRVMGNNHQLLRVDEENIAPLLYNDYKVLISNIENNLQNEEVHAIIFQDYDKGIISVELFEYVNSLAKQKGIPVLVDPKRKNFTQYKNIDFFKPNLKELKEGISCDVDDISLLEDIIKTFQEQQNIQTLMLTLSEKGILISSERGKSQEYIPAHIRAVSDVSGAGDTVISTAALCIASKLSPMATAQISNIAGGLVCEYAGVVPIEKKKLLSEVKKIMLRK